ncbi:iron-containing alcohol dehydrogenase [Parageobacillus thermoglucosidasius]|uniref:long-chain-alcohol dehydrogenase n=2 Tax=Parageobacillus thermoglucosidasius TaxID=1426 RepID=A0AAN1D5V3_PARTM|nr:iron-containing alcohol dehydrogenase [Parageobacillus thermoglucosidasius]ALF09197.1 alcohol dehydrogenase [Parageobacillus thermoglucosidasius]ANZ29280.1 alcohol dehydrogenase [Parageobacillus thermoglucosidasius]APM80018.1 alcohol dehydrogenase [Parageobacillus thermoglucosidasius]KJX69971.1 alcohol dehydrogenase [Parageobacillus thermoglucosidasius]MED4904965.1 iron-containing alcohol dehydrogenase [Parageobacillus thermoglucosidasius]
MNIHKFVMPEVIFGNGAIEHAGESCLRLGATNVFIVSDPGVIEAGWLDVVIRSCKQANLQYTVFSDVTMNPKDVEVEKGCKAYIENECDAIIGIGGGSPLDVAKAVAILVTNGGKIHDYEGVNKIRKPLPPQVMIPTTAGSGSEVSQFSVIVDTLGQKKMTIISKSLIPDIAIIDPETLSTKNAHLTASTGLDVLTHGIEAYVSLAATPLTDVQAKNAISLVSEYLRPSVASKINKEAKTKMAMASLQAGLAFSNAILGAVHAMSHAVGGKYPVLHGDINSILLPHVMEYNLLANPKKFADIAAFLGVDIRGLSHMEAGRKAIECIKQLTMEIDAPQRLSDIGLEKDEIPHMSLVALDDACMITNPRDVTAEDIEEIFRRAW